MRHRVFLFCMLALLLALSLVSCENGYNPPLNIGGPASTLAAPGQAGTPAQAATGKFQEFALPQSDSGLMRPVLDAQGRLWFGEMSRNYLGSFDPHSGKFWQQTPPHGKWGIMGMVVAPDDTIWFAEQYANYIGHYFPGGGIYKTYPLPTISVPDPNNAGKTLHLPSAPNDLALDKHGTLWFTELNTNAIGSLNTANGSLRRYTLPPVQKGQDLNPYGITVDSQGIIWFTGASTSRLGRLDPATGQVRYFAPPGVTSSLMEVVSDAHGQIWATTFAGGQLLRFNPARASFTIYTAPTPHGASGGLYGIAVGSNGDIWITVTAENLLARLDVKAGRFSYYIIPTPNSLPLGLAEGPDRSIWFTEAGSNKIGKLEF